MEFYHAGKIWLTAAAIHALLFTTYLMLFTSDFNVTDIGSTGISLLLISFIATLILSLPAATVLSIVISACMSSKLKGSAIYMLVLGSGILLTLATCVVVYSPWLSFYPLFPMACMPVASITIAIAWQRKAIKSLSIENLQTGNHEN
jgi:hypothetical protein